MINVRARKCVCMHESTHMNNETKVHSVC